MFLIISGMVFSVLADQYSYLSKIKDYYRVKSLQYHLNCEGNAKWLEDTAKATIVFSYQRTTLTNISMAYLSPNGDLSTCISGQVSTLNSSLKVKTSTIYQLASVTKIFTADIVLDLVRKGRLSLNDNLVDLLPELRNATYQDNRVKDIQVQHLLAHTAGFDRKETGVLDNMFQPKPWCPDDVQKLTTIDLQFSPNERMSYSNTGYCLLSRIAEEKYQQPYRDIVRKHYQLAKYTNFDFIGDNGKVPTIDSAIMPFTESINFKSLASVAGLYGNATDLTTLVHSIERSKKPNITDKPVNSMCDPTSIYGCHGFMGYEYSSDSRLRFYLRSGDMNNVSALVIIDNEGGVMSMLTNARIRSSGVKQVIVYAYNQRLK